MNINTPSQLQQLTKDFVSDKDFRAKLKQSPKEAILERLSASDATWPKDLQIKVVENDKNTVNLVIPTTNEDGQLTDDDMKSIAAGEGLITVIALFAGFTALAGAVISTGIILPVLGAEGILG